MRKMKASGIEWIGEIPEGWEVATIGHLFSVTAGGDAKPHLYSFVQDTEHPYPVYTNSSNPNQIYAYTSAPIFNENTITVTGRGDIGHAFYRSTKFDAIIRLLVLAPKLALDCRYYAYWIDNVSIFFTNSAAVGQLSAQQISPYKTCYLPLCEQHSIANHLDFYCSKIEHILAEIQNSIHEYKKLKQAVITQAVTKGVRGEREMKDSGNPWFGQIPTDWKLSRVGLHFSIILGKMLCNAPLNNTYTLEPYYCAADVHFDGVADGERQKMWFSPIEKDLYRVSVGDLLVVEGGAGAGGSAIVEKQDSDTYVQNSIMIVRSKGNADSRYLRYLLEFLVKQGYIDVVCNKATIPHFTKDKLSCIPFCLCPTGEQEEIADYLDAKCAEIDGLIAKKEQLVKELESYKKSLIYEVVTGKREIFTVITRKFPNI